MLVTIVSALVIGTSIGIILNKHDEAKKKKKEEEKEALMRELDERYQKQKEDQP